jgi:hypothetical protein
VRSTCVGVGAQEPTSYRVDGRYRRRRKMRDRPYHADGEEKRDASLLWRTEQHHLDWLRMESGFDDETEEGPAEEEEKKVKAFG